MIELETNYTIDTSTAFVSAKPISENLERLLAIEIITIDHRKRLMNDIFRHKNCVCCSPRFLSLRVQCELSRNLVKLLSYKLELKRLSVEALHMAVFLFYGLFKLLLKVLAYNVNDLAESSLYCVINRIIDNSLAIRTETVHLLESAIAAAHT